MTHYGHLVRILHGCFSQAVNNALARMELTSAQGHIMGYLAHRAEPPCPRDIEETFHLSHPTVSGLLARLEKKGFLRLEPDPDDRRCKRVYLTEKGRDCDEAIRRSLICSEQQLLQGFTAEEQAQFRIYLERAIHNLGGQCYLPQNENEEENNQ